MSKNCPIMQRMKSNYESRSRTFLTRRTPVIIRLDGKAFHTYTRGLDKPFDEGLIEDMQNTAKYLCENIQGCKLAYTQSDEISLLITDYDKLTTDAWFDYSVQKMASISASMATARFNQLRLIRYAESNEEVCGDHPDRLIDVEGVIWHENISDSDLAFFDSRVFNIPKEEVSNYFKARQRDAVKNSIAMLAQSMYSPKELHGKNGSEMQEMSFQKGINWNDLHYSKKRGSTIGKILHVNGKSLEKFRNEQFCTKDSDIDENNSIPKLGDLWYQRDGDSSFYPDKRGRLLEFAKTDELDWDDWCDIPIKSVRTKWESVETPMDFNEEYFKFLI